MKASLIAYDGQELHKKSELKIVKYGYVRGCPKRPTTQIGSLEILGINPKMPRVPISWHLNDYKVA
jgi:hypothetical protein